MNNTKVVLIAVAKLLSTFLIPILAKIAVSAAKTAERIAAKYQVILI